MLADHWLFAYIYKILNTDWKLFMDVACKLWPSIKGHVTGTSCQGAPDINIFNLSSSGGQVTPRKESFYMILLSCLEDKSLFVCFGPVGVRKWREKGRSQHLLRDFHLIPKIFVG